MKYALINQDGVVELHEDSSVELPAGAIALTEEQYDLLVDGWVYSGGVVVPPPPIPPPSIESLKASAVIEVKALRTAFFSILAGLQSEALTRGNQSLAMAIADIQEGGKLITQTDLSACTTKEQIDAAFYAAWVALVSAAPSSVITAFQSVKS